MSQHGPLVIMFTDGSALGNPGPAGLGVVLMSGAHRLEISQGFRLSTNNRMELLAVIVGLEALKKPDCKVQVHTDSKYVHDAVSKGWLRQWQRNGWRTAQKSPVKNPDLWKRFMIVEAQHQIEFVWVKGHAGIPENERCDVLATTAASGKNLMEDDGYLAGIASGDVLL
jgi:ribonuclease HI